MKFLVDEMPYFQDDCPFLSGRYCRLDECECTYITEHEARYRPDHEDECRWLAAKKEDV